MRWDRLFADLEGQAADLELEERDALVSELREGEWAETSWRDLVGGHVVLEVVGLGRVEGEARLVNETVVHLAFDGWNTWWPARRCSRSSRASDARRHRRL